MGPRALSGSADRITDDDFRARFVAVPRTLERWLRWHRGFAGKSVLDFGCGHGITALALALRHEARVVGVDVMPDPERCLPLASAQIGLAQLPPNLSLHRVVPGMLHDDRDRFDVVYSWSVFEHVDPALLDPVLARIHECLRLGGLFLVQIEPLYYSAKGSHLSHKLPEPWVHLLREPDDLLDELTAAVPDPAERDALWSTYRTLNRITAPGLLERIGAAGFEVLRTYYTKDRQRPPDGLAKMLDRELLTTNQVVLLARRL